MTANDRKAKNELMNAGFKAIDAAAEPIREKEAVLIVDTSDLREAVVRMRGMVPRKPTLPILACIWLGERNGYFFARCNTLEQSLGYSGKRLAPDFIDKTPVIVEYAKLAAILPHIRGDKVAFYPVKSNAVKIHSGALTANLIRFAPEGYPEEIEYCTAPFLSVEASFIEELKIALKCVSDYDDIFRKALGGVNVEITGNQCNIIATDGKRLYIRKLASTAAQDTSFIIPGYAVRQLQTVFKKSSSRISLIRSDDFLIVHDNNKLIYRCKLINATFPSWRQVMPEKTPNHLNFSAFVWHWMLDSVALSGAMDTVNIKTHIDTGRIEFSARIFDMVASTSYQLQTDQVAISEDASVYFSARFLRDALSVLRSDAITVSYLHTTAPFVFESEYATYVVMPIRHNPDGSERK